MGDGVIAIEQDYPYGFRMPERAVYKARPGLSRRMVEELSYLKAEPLWMRSKRLSALEIFEAKPMPTWGADLSGVDFENIVYYLKPTERQARRWQDLPREIRETYDRLGIPEAERKYLAGVEAMYESESIYNSIREDLRRRGVIFCDTDTAVRHYPDLVRQYFGTIVPAADNKFAALNTAVWSGGSFIFVPKGVSVELPLQAYFRINAERFGQFERTLIIAEEGSRVDYVESCSAPIYTTDSLHAAVVEIIVKRGATVQYTTIQNWASNIYNLVTKRMRIEEEGTGRWIDFNQGSKVTMKYPSTFLVGRQAHGEVLSLAIAGRGQHQDTGGKAIHAAPETTSRITSKSLSFDGGRTSYRGLLRIEEGAKGSHSHVRCDALILDPRSRSDTYPTMDIRASDVRIEHEASVSRVGEEQLFYLRSRGLKEEQALALIVNGFAEPVVRELPMEFAVEVNRMIALEMRGAVG